MEEINPFSLSLLADTFYPILPQIQKHTDYENKSDYHCILYVEEKDSLLLQTLPFLKTDQRVISSNRQEYQFQEFCYFLLFTILKNQHHRYGLYFNPQSLSILELKLTLYAYPHHPVEVLLYQQDKKIAHQYVFGHHNFNFFLSWEVCKQYPLTIVLNFIDQYSYQSHFEFRPLI